MLLQRQVKPLPALVYNFSAINEALRQFSAAKHVGKVVVKLPALTEEASGPKASLSSQAAWMITGGLGALGVIAAKWLAGQGTKNLHLLGRSGRQAPCQLVYKISGRVVGFSKTSRTPFAGTRC